MTMSFIRIEFTDDSFNIILREFDVCQVLIVTGIVDEGRTLLFSIIEHYFAKKELKRWAFLLKPVTNLLL